METEKIVGIAGGRGLIFGPCCAELCGSVLSGKSRNTGTTITRKENVCLLSGAGALSAQMNGRSTRVRQISYLLSVCDVGITHRRLLRRTRHDGGAQDDDGKTISCTPSEHRLAHMLGEAVGVWEASKGREDRCGF